MKQMKQDNLMLVTLPDEQLNPEEDKQRRKLTLSDVWQFLRFCVVGSLNAIIDFAVLNVFLWIYPTTNTERILVFNSLAVLLASTNSFFFNKYWTFKQHQSITSREVFRFIVIAGATTIMNDVLMLLLALTFPNIMRSTLIGANALKLGAILGTMSISFFGMRLWVFWQKGRAETKPITNNMLTTSLVTAAVHISELPTIRVKAQRVIKTLIIIPTYNEYENLSLLLHGIFSYAPTTDVLIVDDNSPDGTGKLADETAARNAHVHVLHRPGKLGLGTAYIAGFKYAIEQGYDAAFEMDADFSHDPRYLPDFLKAIEDSDVVIGSRYIPGGKTPNWSASRRLISGSGNIFARFMLGISVHDCTGGFRCYRRKVLQSLDLDSVKSRGYAFQVELTYRVQKQGFKIVETPITFMDRRLGTSKMSRKIVVEAFTYVLRTRFSRQTPLQRTVTWSSEPTLKTSPSTRDPLTVQPIQTSIQHTRSTLDAFPGYIAPAKAHQVMKTLIIIPTYNECENLSLLLHDIFSYASKTDVLIVDDNSPDGTGKLADEFAAKDARVHVLHRPGKLGLGTAYIAGFKYSIANGYDAAFEMDADFSHDPRHLPAFLETIKNADLVIGSRYIPGGSTPNWSIMRRVISGFGNVFARFMLNISVHDCTGGFRCYRSYVLQNIDLDSVQSRGYAFQVELTYRTLKQKFKIVETPITFMDRRLGTSKMSRKIVIEALQYVLMTKFRKQVSLPPVIMFSSEPTLSASSYARAGLTVQPIRPTSGAFPDPITPLPTSIYSYGTVLDEDIQRKGQVPPRSMANIPKSEYPYSPPIRRVVLQNVD